MTELLGRLFIKNRDNVKDPAVRRAWGTLVSVLCILFNVLLSAFKFLVGTLAGSLSIMADAANNLSDAGASVVALLSFKLAAKPADRDHPFGHARIEYIASMVVSFLILFVAVELVRGAIEKIVAPVLPVFSVLTVAVLGVSVLCKLYIAYFNRRVGKKIDSDVMRATAADSLSDAAATTAVLLSQVLILVLPAQVGRYVDPAMSIAVAVMVFFAGINVLKDAKDEILGTAPSDEVVATIQRIVDEYPDALGIHDLMVHSYGAGRTVVSLHIEVDGKKDMFASHDMIDLIERRLFAEAQITCTVHMDPIVTDDPELDRWLAIASKAAAAIDPRLRLHDFRMVPGLTHTNLIFDVAVPFEISTSDQEIKDALAAAVAKEDPTHFTVITVDRV